MAICLKCGYTDCHPYKRVPVIYGKGKHSIKVEEGFFQCPKCGQKFTRRVKEEF